MPRATSLLLLVVLLGHTLALLPGCGPAATGQPTVVEQPELTPAQFAALPEAEKARYRTTVIRIPEGLDTTSLLPFDKGPFASVVDRAVHTGTLEALMSQYNRAIFEARHPRVRVEFVPFEMWSDDYRAVLAVALASGTAPAVYVARDLPGSAEQGLFADITDLIREWDQAELQPAGSVAQGLIGGRHYVIARGDLACTVIRYRKDWFKEAGLFNEHGEPGPPTNWTWEDFKRIAKKLADPSKRRWGYSDQTMDFGWAGAHGLMYYVPDKTGEHTWRFNDQDPRVYTMLADVREMVVEDKSVVTGVSVGWYQWHQEFDAGRVAMIPSWAPHIPSAMLTTPYQFGRDKPYGETVGMALLPTGPGGVRELLPESNIYGFNPSLTEEELQAAFAYMKDSLYGDTIVNLMRVAVDRGRVFGKGEVIYQQLLISPYRLSQTLETPKKLEEVFPPDYIRTYDLIKQAPAPPLPRNFGLSEPPYAEFQDALRAMFSEALTDPEADLKKVVARAAAVINTNLLDFKDEDDRAKIKAFYTAYGEYYRDNYPDFHETVWPGLLEGYYKVW